MKYLTCILLASLGAACSTLQSDLIKPGDLNSGDWRPFYSRDFPEDARRLDYFYDASSMRKTRNHVIARWKIFGSTGAMVLYVVDINCPKFTLTEKGSVLLDPNGSQRTIPRSQLAIDSPIKNGSSSAAFHSKFCQDASQPAQR